MNKTIIVHAYPATSMELSAAGLGPVAGVVAAIPWIASMRQVSHKVCFLACILLGACAPNSYAQESFTGWGPSYEFESFGFNPSVALYGSTAVEVHNGQSTAGPMWYRVGQVSGETINWGASYEYDWGFNPSVAIFGSTAVEVHNGQSTAGAMWYHVGQVNGSTINWGPSLGYDWGFNPSVALDGATVVEVHNGQGTFGPMW